MKYVIMVKVVGEWMKHSAHKTEKLAIGIRKRIPLTYTTKIVMVEDKL
jgi:hypothetical protein